MLNQEQLVLSFIQPLAGTDRWNSIPVKIRVKDKGVYLVEAVTGNLRAYTILTVSDIVMINKMGKTDLPVLPGGTGGRRTDFGVGITQLDKHSDRVTRETDADGLSTFSVPEKHGESIRLIAMKGKDVAFNDLNTYYLSGGKAAWTGYVYTDRPVYRPGDPVHFRGILRKQAVVGYQTPTAESVSVEITDPDREGGLSEDADDE